MLLTHAISILSVISTVVFAELVPVSPYIGQHKANCNSHSALTGALVGTKIYTFGGCYAIPYVVDPDDETEEPLKKNNDHENVTDSSHVYDTTSDTWSFETNTPRPLRGSSTLVVNKDIYFYNINAEPRTNQLDLWKYNTDTKTWSELAQLPFIKLGNLLTCHSNDKMYFMGSSDGYQQNIIRVYNLATNYWEDSIYLDKRITAKQILCHDTHISMIGEEVNNESSFLRAYGVEKAFNQNLINAYYNGSVEVIENFNVTLGYNYNGARAQVFPLKEWFYTFALNESKNAAEIIKLNTLTLETVALEAPPYILTDVLMLPTEDDEIYLFGGRKERLFGKLTTKEQENELVPKIKTYNHKIIMQSSPTAAAEEEERIETNEKDHHFKVQTPDK
ncbi:hypothetical protein G6F42_012197 [Rhizopus arrhizus]|nr:hypothetical protein G6F42_012197 [Rhizopus arrhizus]